MNRIKSLNIWLFNKEQKSKIEDQLPGIPKENIIPEPLGRNTAPCIGLAATVIKKLQDQNEVMVVLPADHLIGNASSFSIISVSNVS